MASFCLIIYSITVTILLLLFSVPPTGNWLMHNVLSNIAPASRAYVAEKFVYAPSQQLMLSNLLETRFFDFVNEMNVKSIPVTSKEIAAHINLEVDFVNVCIQNLLQMHLIEKPGFIDGGVNAVRLSKISRLHLLSNSSYYSFVDEIVRAGKLQSIAAQHMSEQFKKARPVDDAGASYSSSSSLRHIIVATSHTAAREVGAEIESEMWRNKMFKNHITSLSDFADGAAQQQQQQQLSQQGGLLTSVYRVLDFGCGTGGAGATFATALERSAQDRGPLHFVEPHVTFFDTEEMLQQFARKIHGTLDRASFVAGSIFNTSDTSSFVNGSFDLVILHEVFSFFGNNNNSRAVAENAFAALKPGGRVAVADVVARESEEYLPSLLDLIMIQPVMHNLMLRQVSSASAVPSLWQVHKLLRDAGFIDVESTNAYPRHFSVVFARKP